MSRYISDSMRLEVGKLAGFRCEYCRIHEADTIFTCEVDHVVSLKHGGRTILQNLAFACFFCNRNKGSDIATILLPDPAAVRLFDPRTEVWADHFQLAENVIEPLSKTGEATIKVLKMNHFERLIERAELIAEGRYP